jgi:hypothetical protein
MKGGEEYSRYTVFCVKNLFKGESDEDQESKNGDHGVFHMFISLNGGSSNLCD